MNVFCSCIEVSKIDETSLVNALLQQSTSIQYYLTILVLFKWAARWLLNSELQKMVPSWL